MPKTKSKLESNDQGISADGNVVLARSALLEKGMGSRDWMVGSDREDGALIRAGGPVVPGVRSPLADMVARHARSNGGEQGALVTVEHEETAAAAAERPKRSARKPKLQQPDPPVVERPPVAPPESWPKPPKAIMRRRAFPLSPATTPQTVIFNLPHGKLRSRVVAVLDSPTGFVLVYENPEALQFVPSQGSMVSVTLPEDRTVQALFTGCVFEWYTGHNRLLFFIKEVAED